MSRALPCRARVGAAAALLVISVAVGLAVARGGPASHGTVVITPADVPGIDENSSTDSQRPRGTVTLAFAADVHFQLHLAALLDHPSGALGPITQTLRAADVTMVNLESAITDRGTPEAKELEVASQRYYYRTSPAALGVLAAAGIDVVSMANNHGADYGPVGLADTLASIRTAGPGQPATPSQPHDLLDHLVTRPGSVSGCPDTGSHLETMNILAATDGDQPSSTMNLASLNRAFGVTAALAWEMRASWCVKR